MVNNGSARDKLNEKIWWRTKGVKIIIPKISGKKIWTCLDLYLTRSK